MTPRTLAIALCTAALASACGGPGDNATAPQAAPAEDSSKTVDGYTVHFSAQLTDSLPPQVARQYNIVRSGKRAMLNVTIIEDDGSPTTGAVNVKTVNLTGQLKNVQMRKIEEQEAVYYIGVTPVENNETLVFDISVTPEGRDEPIDVRFKRQFYTN